MTMQFVGVYFGFFFFFVFFLRVTPAAYGGAWARGQNGAVATGLGHSHPHMGSKLRLQPISELTA